MCALRPLVLFYASNNDDLPRILHERMLSKIEDQKKEPWEIRRKELNYSEDCQCVKEEVYDSFDRWTNRQTEEKEYLAQLGAGVSDVIAYHFGFQPTLSSAAHHVLVNVLTLISLKKLKLVSTLTKRLHVDYSDANVLLSCLAKMGFIWHCTSLSGTSNIDDKGVQYCEEQMGREKWATYKQLVEASL